MFPPVRGVKKVAAMPPKLSVLVQVDLDTPRVIIKVTGALTAVSQQGLYPLIRRARTLIPGIRVTVDLTGVLRVEAAGARLLQEALHHAELTGRGAPVQVLWPASSPAPALVCAGTVAA